MKGDLTEVQQARWRSFTLLALLVTPVLIVAAIATYALWAMGLVNWYWLLVPGCWGVALLLARRWKTSLVPLPKTGGTVALHWTPRDEKAWQVVKGRVADLADIPMQDLISADFYLHAAQSLAREIAAVYHPEAEDPLSNRTLLEVGAATQLAIDDVVDLMERYVPGSHVLTIRRWRSFAGLPKWYDRASNLYWITSAFFGPAAAAGRFAISRLVLGPVTRNMQGQVMTWLYVAFTHRLGFYLIEMNSGRLAGGVRRYRAAMAQAGARDRLPPEVAATGAPPPPSERDDEPEIEPATVTVALLGQTGAGKSSLVRTLLGAGKPEEDHLPKTQNVRRLTYRPTGGDEIVLLDTVGYGDADMTPAQRQESLHALASSDLVWLVMAANNPARELDKGVLTELKRLIDADPTRKMPAVVGVLTHVDLLRPLMEWEPPYDWQSPARPKAQTIHDVVAFTRETFGELLAAVVPVCVEPDREWGVEEGLLPATTVLLDEAHAGAVIRTLQSGLDRERYRMVAKQMADLGRKFLRVGYEKLTAPPA